MKKKQRVAEQQAPVDYREDYDEKLVQLNRRLADTRTEHHRARNALDDGEADYVGTRERRDMVLGENGLLISERQKSVDGLLAEKQRLVAEVDSHSAIVDALYESRVVQFDRMLTRLKEDAEFVRTRFDTATQKTENRATMMDKITRVLENAKNLKQFNKYRRKYIPEKKDQRLIKLYKQQARIVNKLKKEQMVEKKMSRKENIVPDKPYVGVHLHQEHSSHKIVPQRENSKHESLVELNQLGSVIKLKRKLVEDITQQDLTENESQEWRCSYLKKLIDEIRTVVDKVKQYVINEGQPTSYDTTDFEWLLNKGAVGQFATCKTASIQTYDYDVELNINQSYTECNRKNLQM